MLSRNRLLVLLIIAAVIDWLWPSDGSTLPYILAFSGGGGSSGSRSSSGVAGTKFKKKYLDQFFDYFGRGDQFDYGGPKFNPQYKGFSNFDDVESSAYESSKDKLTTAYNDVIGRQREELSQSGLLTSPNQYIEGGARDVANRNLLSSLGQAKRDARSMRLGLEETEAGRETQFNAAKATALTNTFLSMFNAVAGVGRFSRSSGSSSSSTNPSFSVLWG